MIRVVVLHPRDLSAPTQGGIQTFLHDFVKHSPDDFDITVAGVTQDPEARPVGVARRVRIGSRHARLLPLATAGELGRDPGSMWRMLVAQARLRRRFLDRRTILQVHRPFRPAVLAGHQGPRVQFVHLDIRYWPGPSGWPRLGHLYRPFSDSFLERMSRVYVVNELGADLLRAEHPTISDRICFLPVWFDEQVFRAPGTAEREALRDGLADRLGLGAGNRDDRLILFAGRLEPVKDPGLAIGAVAEAVKASRPVRLIVAGDGALQRPMATVAQEMGIADRVHFLGDVPRQGLAQLMRASDLLLLSSQSEGGGPRVVLEALATGLPVVATKVGDIARTVRSGENGWLTESHEPGALAEGICWALDQPADALARAAHEAVAPYTARRVLAPLYEDYRALADSQPAPSRST